VRRTRGLLSCGLAAGPVFVTAFLIQGATREGYRPSRHPVSSLALGPRGWVQAANFAVTGTLVLAAAAGLGRAADPALSSRAGRALIGAAGAGLIGAVIGALVVLFVWHRLVMSHAIPDPGDRRYL